MTYKKLLKTTLFAFSLTVLAQASFANCHHDVFQMSVQLQWQGSITTKSGARTSHIPFAVHRKGKECRALCRFDDMGLVGCKWAEGQWTQTLEPVK